jgi:signal peptidase II
MGRAGRVFAPRMALRSRIAFALALVISLAGCDQATKRIAETSLRGAPPISLISGVLDLTYTENRDVGFSLLRAIEGDDVRRAVIVTFGLFALVAIAIAIVRWRERSLTGIAGLSLIAAGALGNLIDRFARGYVVDFVHLHHYPVFNVADVSIALGVALLFLASRGARDPAPD